ncbi:MAG: CotY/CotZ family spore coat protein [Turicibacter sp.]
MPKLNQDVLKSHSQKKWDTKDSPCCVFEMVNYIDQLQKNLKIEKLPCNNLLTTYLGSSSLTNTRPFVLYLPNGNPFELAYFCAYDLVPTTIFRVEEIHGKCAILQVIGKLAPNHYEGYCVDELTRLCEPSTNVKFVPTQVYFTVDLTKFMAIHCLDDIFLPTY